MRWKKSIQAPVWTSHSAHGRYHITRKEHSACSEPGIHFVLYRYDRYAHTDCFIGTYTTLANAKKVARVVELTE